jgi:hypothetical protein
VLHGTFQKLCKLNRPELALLTCSEQPLARQEDVKGAHPRGLLCADDAHSAAGNEGAQEGCRCQYRERCSHCGPVRAPVLCLCWHQGGSSDRYCPYHQRLQIRVLADLPCPTVSTPHRPPFSTREMFTGALCLGQEVMQNPSAAMDGWGCAKMPAVLNKVSVSDGWVSKKI